MNISWHSYPKIFALGHKAISELFLNDVLVEEKIDGSQFSFGKFGDELKVRSHGKVMISDAPEKMFEKAVEVVKTLDLHDGWTYRTEYLQKSKHNALAYDRTPKNNLIIFDINTNEEEYLSYDEKRIEAERIGLEIVPILYYGQITEPKILLEFLEKTSILGGQKIEGVVVKNYYRFGEDKKVLMGKYVSEVYKEVHSAEWRKANPSNSDVVQRLIMELKTPARWEKAIQHLREDGRLTQSPKDIGELIKEVQKDIKEECADEIKDALFKHTIGHIIRGITAGLPEWYKEKLLNLQFNETEN